MDAKNIRQLINERENPFVGFSNCTTELVDSVFQTICSFLNKEGGTLIIGVQDFGKIITIADVAYFSSEPVIYFPPVALHIPTRGYGKADNRPAIQIYHIRG